MAGMGTQHLVRTMVIVHHVFKKHTNMFIYHVFQITVLIWLNSATILHTIAVRCMNKVDVW